MKEQMVWTPEGGSTYPDEPVLKFVCKSYRMWAKKIIRDIRYPDGPPKR